MFDGIDVKAGIYYLTKNGGFDINSIRSKFLNKLCTKDYTRMKDVLEENVLDGWPY